MIIVRPSNQRGHADFGWLDSRHTFSFGQYHDPAHMGFRALRVINDDRVAGGGGFPMHGHKDMEILSWVVEGALRHEDSMGNGNVVTAGGLQYMGAGTGVRHGEFNPSPDQPVRFLQIWAMPDATCLAPAYGAETFDPSTRRDMLKLVASRSGRQGSVAVRADLDLFAADLSPGAVIEHTLVAGHGAWVQVIDGSVTLNGLLLEAGDGAKIENETALSLTAKGESSLLLFDLG